MKIKRTLPSVSCYMPNHDNTSRFQKSLASTYQPNRQPTFRSVDKRPSRSTPKQQIVGSIKRITTPQFVSEPENTKLKTLKKTITFANMMDTSPENQRQSQPNISLTGRSASCNCRVRKRKIFQKQTIKNKNKEARTSLTVGEENSFSIPVSLNIKQVSDLLKKTELEASSAEFNKNILNKIQTLQTIVKDIQNKVTKEKQPYQNQTTDQSPTEPFYQTNNSKTLQNNILRMQLQQNERCESIAKQNQMLYNQLAKKIQIRENYLINQTMRQSLNKSLSSYRQCQHWKSKEKQRILNENIENHRKKMRPFEDFDQFELNQHENIPVGDENGEITITSPFLLKENR